MAQEKGTSDPVLAKSVARNLDSFLEELSVSQSSQAGNDACVMVTVLLEETRRFQELGKRSLMFARKRNIAHLSSWQ